MENLKKKVATGAEAAKSKAVKAKQNIDRRLLELTAAPLEQVRKQLAQRKKDADFALVLASKVLEKAKNVRETLNSEELLKTSQRTQEQLRAKYNETTQKMSSFSRKSKKNPKKS